MAASDTRLLVLGAVAMFEPVNGYQIRRELTSWRVDEWANTNPGSIYGALTALERDGLVLRHEVREVTRTVSVFALSDAGRARVPDLLVGALEHVDLHDRIAFQIAFNLLPLVPARRVPVALRRRRERLVELIGHARRVVEGDEAPPHARRVQALWVVTAEAELHWLDETARLIGEGGLPFALDEDWGWRPPDDDPGWQMSAERDRYRALLGGAPG